MMQRIDYGKVAPDAVRAFLNLERYVVGTLLEPGLLHLVRIRASQINGCAYCIDMHNRDSRAVGEEQQRLDAL
jgi:AhpD family alkylhydroperoxidase